MTATQTPALVATRDSWHRVAEHVLAAGQFAASGTIRLRPSPGGFSTTAGGDRRQAPPSRPPPSPGGFSTTAGVDGRQLAIDGLTLVVSDGGTRRAAPFSTVAALAT